MKDSPSKAFPVSPWILLWSVMCVFGVVALILFNAQAADRAKVQDTRERLVAVEERFKEIQNDTKEIKDTLKILSEAFINHRYLTESRPERIKKAK